MNTYFLYTRKSTDMEDRQVLSIESQLHELREFAAREHLSIASEFVEKKSAKKPGRRVFNDMLARIEAGEADGIIAWHPDRLARNSMDGGLIIYMLDTGKLKSLKFPTFRFEADSQGKFMLNMMFVQSKYYVDSLADNTRRGLREKVRRGEYPGPAPIGYLNDYRSKRLIVDRERAPIVVEAFKRYATGTETQETLRHFFASKGILSRNGKPIGNTAVSHLLSNPIVYGHFCYKGEVHEGIHEPILSKQLFDQVQAVVAERWRYTPATAKVVPKPFLGLLHCAECGGAITAEIQKGHTYYRCTKKDKRVRCSQRYVREEVLDEQISHLLRSFTLRTDWADEMLKLVKEEQRGIAQSSSQAAALKKAEIAKINARLQRLLDSFLDELIDRETFTVEKAKLMSQKKTLQEQQDAHARGRADWLEPFENWILTARNAAKTADAGSLQEKRVLALKIFGSNLVLESKTARGSALKPWSLLVEVPPTGGMVPRTRIELVTLPSSGECSTN